VKEAALLDKGGYREEEGRPSMAHDRLGACGDPLGLRGAEARSSWKVWRELCWTTEDEHRFTCGVKAISRTKGGIYLS